MRYQASKVELIHGVNTITPEPVLTPEWSKIEQLQWSLGCSIEYLKHYCGPVEIPKIEIETDDFNEHVKNMFAIIVNGNGTYVSFDEAWRYINHIFDGMRAVYNIKPMDYKGNVPVLFNFNHEHVIGRSTIKRGAKTTEINIRVFEPMPIEMFDGLASVSFGYYLPPRTSPKSPNLQGL